MNKTQTEILIDLVKNEIENYNFYGETETKEYVNELQQILIKLQEA